MKAAKTLLLAAACSLVVGTARADVVYTFEGARPSADPALTPFLRVDVTDAAVASGSLNLSGQESEQNLLSGDAAKFVSLQYTFFDAGQGGIGTAARNNGDGTYAGMDNFSIAMTFGPGNALASSDVSLTVPNGDGSITAVGGTSSGGAYQLTYDAALSGCNPFIVGGQVCRGTGAWTVASTTPTPTPEPASFALLGVGLVGVAGLRRRIAKGEA